MDFDKTKHLMGRWSRSPLTFPICPIHLAAIVLGVAVSFNGGPILGQGIGSAEIQLIDGSAIDGTVEQIASDGRLTGEGIRDGINIQDVLSIKTPRKVSKSPAELTVFPAGGGSVFGNRFVVADETVSFRGSSGEIKMPLQSLRAVVWSTSDIVKKAISSPSRDNDQVIVQVPDGERVIEGILEGIDLEFVTVNYKSESRQIALSKVKAVVIADLELKSPAGASAGIELQDGSKFFGVISQMTDNVLDLAITGGATLKLDAKKITNVSIASDRLMYLSDTDPIDVQEKSLFAIQLPWKKDRSVGDNPMRLRMGSSNKTIELNKGIGMQAFSQLLFANSNSFDRFSAIVGIDAETGGRGDCRMVVRGDGIELWAKRVRATDEPLEVEVDISGMKEIALIVYPGEDFDLGDHVNWGEARFVKTK